MSFTLEFDLKQNTFTMGGPIAHGSTLAEITLTSYGDYKIDCIKTIRAYTGVSLKEAKLMVETLPWTFRDADVIRTAVGDPVVTLSQFGTALSELENGRVIHTMRGDNHTTDVLKAFAKLLLGDVR